MLTFVLINQLHVMYNKSDRFLVHIFHMLFYFLHQASPSVNETLVTKEELVIL